MGSFEQIVVVSIIVVYVRVVISIICQFLQVIKEEMKPINAFINGGPASSGTNKVDQQALDEVSQ